MIVQCHKCKKTMKDNIEFGEHNKECGSRGWQWVKEGTKGNGKPTIEKTIKSRPKDPEVAVNQSDLSSKNKSVLDSLLDKTKSVLGGGPVKTKKGTGQPKKVKVDE